MRVQDTEIIASEGIALAQRAFAAIGVLFREQSVHDYGIDAHVEIVEDNQATGRLIGVQVKSGPSFFQERDEAGFVYRADDKHVQYWLNHALPVIVTLCDLERSLVYWQSISESTVVSTGKQWKVIVPEGQLVVPDALEQVSELATKVVPVDKYSVLEQVDISVGIAKRYRLRVQLNATLSRPEIAAVIRQVVSKYAQSRYYRNERVAARWGDHDASIISLFVYLSPDDAQDNNWICRSLWVDENYPSHLPRPTCQGENIGANIVVDWSTWYEGTARHLRSYSVSKEAYLSGVDEIMSRLVPVVDGIATALRQERMKNGEDAGPFLQSISETIRSLENRLDELGRPPLECAEIGVKLGALVGYAVNIVAPYIVHADKPIRNKYNEDYLIEDFERVLPEFRYELNKVR